jgi:hypothetical protein
MDKKSESGSGNNNPGSYFRELSNLAFIWNLLKYLFFDADPGSAMEKNSKPESGIRDGKNPQH